MARIFIPFTLRRLADDQSHFDVTAKTLREAIDALERECPGIKEQLCAGESLSPSLQVAIDHSMTRRMSAPLQADSEIHFLPAIGGG